VLQIPAALSGKTFDAGRAQDIAASWQGSRAINAMQRMALNTANRHSRTIVVSATPQDVCPEHFPVPPTRN